MSPALHLQLSVHPRSSDAPRTTILQDVGGLGLAIHVCLEDWRRGKKTNPHLTRPGVYILWDKHTPEPHTPVYIGKADDVSNRIGRHMTERLERDLFTDVVVFGKKERHSDETLFSFLEARMLKLVQERNNCRLTNGKNETVRHLNDMDSYRCEEILRQCRRLLPILGPDIFPADESSTAVKLESKDRGGNGKSKVERHRKVVRPQKTVQELPLLDDVAVDLHMRASKLGIDAEGTWRRTQRGISVRQGSRARKSEARKCPEYIKEMRRALLRDGTLAVEGESFRFTRLKRFKSLSAAAGVIKGGAVSGNEAWVDSNGRTVKEILAATRKT